MMLPSLGLKLQTHNIPGIHKEKARLKEMGFWNSFYGYLFL